jgi:hypothetical protein
MLSTPKVLVTKKLSSFDSFSQRQKTTTIIVKSEEVDVDNDTN